MPTLEERIAREPVKRYVKFSGDHGRDIVQQRTYDMEYSRELSEWRDLVWIMINDPVRWSQMVHEEEKRLGRRRAK